MSIIFYRLFFSTLLISDIFISEVWAGATREQMEKLSQGFRNTCINKIGADRSLVEGIRNGKFPEDADNKLKCYTRCIATLTKLLTKDGEVDLNAVIKQANIMMTDDIGPGMINAATQCKEEIKNEGDPCDFAWAYVQCTYSKNPDIFFFP